MVLEQNLPVITLILHTIIWLALWVGKMNRLVNQAGEMALSCLLGITHCVPQENSILFPSAKSFIDQACLVKMAGYWPLSFFACL